MSLSSAILGFFLVTISIITLIIILELIFRINSWFQKTFIIEEVSRKDFLSDEYQDYINRVEDWSKPMFYYLPVGLRLFNLDNPLPERVQNNSLGFRCREFTPPSPETYRIVLLGGSAAWGSGSTDNSTTIAGYLEKIINNDPGILGTNKKAECYNLAQLNGHQTQDILSLAFFCETIQPDLILSFTGWNELISTETMNEELLDRFGLFYIEEMEGWEPINVSENKNALLKESVKLWLNEHFEIAKNLRRSGRNKSGVRTLTFEEMLTKRSLLFQNHLKIINRLSNSYNADHIQFLQPYLYRKSNLTQQEEKVIKLYDEVRPVHGGKKMGDYLRNNNIYEPMLSEFIKYPKKYGAVHDLCDMFRDENDTVFHTLVHLNDKGYKSVAEKIIRQL